MIFNIFSILAAVLSFVLIDNLALQILGVSISIIALIVLGEKSALEERWEGLGLPGREAIAPVVALGVFVFQGQIPQSTIFQVFVDMALRRRRGFVDDRDELLVR